MKIQKELFSHFASVLPVTDITKSLDFYQNKLGFELTFTWKEPVEYAVLKRGDVSIHLTQKQNTNTPLKLHNSLYIFVHDVEQVYEEFISKNVRIKNELNSRDYGMNDFDIADPDGYMLTFGKNSE